MMSAGDSQGKIRHYVGGFDQPVKIATSKCKVLGFFNYQVMCATKIPHLCFNPGAQGYRVSLKNDTSHMTRNFFPFKNNSS